MKTSDAHLAKLFEEVWSELHRLQTAWSLYFCLYGSSDTIDLLRSTAMVSFGAIQELLIEAIYLRTQRLLERGRRRASIESLIRELPTASALRRQLQKRLDASRGDCTALKAWRDRWVAHRDRATALGQGPSLPRVHARSVGRTIEFIADALTAISDECALGRPYNLHREMDDLDIHEVIDRLRASSARG